MYKSPTGIYWRQFLKLEKIDICALLGGWANSLPVVEYSKKMIYKVCPFLPRRCPFIPGKFYGYNMSIDGKIGRGQQERISPILFPNGAYRTVYKFYADEDPEGATVRVQQEYYHVENADNTF